MLGIITTGLTATLLQIGVGQVVGRWVFRERTLTLGSAFWVGWAAVIAFLQLWHLGFPISWATTATFIIVGVVGLRQLKATHFILSNWLWLGVGGIALVLVSNSGLSAPVFYDNGLYHFQSIRWAESYPVIPGLGNLHGRLAFNSSYFLYVAWLDFIVPGVAGFRVANGLATSVLVLEAIGVLADAFRTRQWTPHCLMAGLILVPLFFTAFDPLARYLASPTSDYFVFILVLKISWTLLQFLDSTEDSVAYGKVLITLSIALITVKLSGGIFAVFTILIVAALMLYRTRQHHYPRSYVWGGIVVMCGALLGPWLYRNVILSGYLVYPSTLLPFPVEWRIPVVQALDDTHWVEAWARRPEAGIHWSEVLGNWDWLAGWQVNFWRTRGIRLSVLLAATSWGVTIAGLVWVRRIPPIIKTILLWVLPSVVALVVWFFSAPDPRFALAYFWLLALGGCVAAVESISPLKVLSTRLLHYRLVEWGGAIAIVGLLVLSRGALWNSAAAPIPIAPIEGYTTDSGLMVYTPQEGSELCWNAPLPCTPYPKPTLRLRDANNLGSGFIQE